MYTYYPGITQCTPKQLVNSPWARSSWRFPIRQMFIWPSWYEHVWTIQMSGQIITAEPCFPEAWNHGCYRGIIPKWPNISGWIIMIRPEKKLAVWYIMIRIDWLTIPRRCTFKWLELWTPRVSAWRLPRIPPQCGATTATSWFGI